MKIAFDTNVILDAIANRAGFQEAQALVMAVVAEKKMTVTMTVAPFFYHYVFSNSATNSL